VAHVLILPRGAANTVSVQNVDMNFQYNNMLIMSFEKHTAIAGEFSSYVVFFVRHSRDFLPIELNPKNTKRRIIKSIFLDRYVKARMIFHNK